MQHLSDLRSAPLIVCHSTFSSDLQSSLRGRTDLILLKVYRERTSDTETVNILKLQAEMCYNQTALMIVDGTFVGK